MALRSSPLNNVQQRAVRDGASEHRAEDVMWQVVKRAKDGGPRAKEPKQDEQGRWFCPSCGRAEGFASKMSVLGHLRHCRPGRPALSGVLAGQPVRRVPSVVVPSPAESSVVQMLSAMQARLDELALQQAQIGKGLGNHIGHLGAVNASGSGRSPWPWIVGGVGVVGALAVAQASRSAPASGLNGITDSEFALACRQLTDLRDRGEDVTVPDSCESVRAAHRALSREPRSARVRRGAALASTPAAVGDWLKLGASAVGLAKGLKGLVR